MHKKYSVATKIKRIKEQEKISIDWRNIVVFISLTIVYATILAYSGLFKILFLVPGILLIFYFSGAFYSFFNIIQSFFLEEFDLLRFFIFFACVIWIILLLIFSPFPAFSGRDEGSYSNAAIYLAKYHNIKFNLPLANYFNTEGPAHQLLNFPGFVRTGDQVSSQFSPAYFVFLAIFYIFTEYTDSFFIANSILIIGGAVAFYLLLRQIVSRWYAFSGFLALIFNFLVIWFPRFTLSENLAFFLFANLLYFLYLFQQSKEGKYLLAVTSITAVFPLARPEGWWIVFVVMGLLIYWDRKKIITIAKQTKFLNLILFLTGILVAIYAVYNEFPIYKRLFRDWLKWPATSSSYSNLISKSLSLGDISNVFLAIFPSKERLIYYLKVEWNYGVLVFGLVAISALVVLLVDRRKKLFSQKIRRLIGITAILSIPFFFAFISPQISADNPWMLRRFMSVVLICGILAWIILINSLKDDSIKAANSVKAIFLALMILPSLPATTYFVATQTDFGRQEALKKMGEYFKEGNNVFFSRDSSGDGWKMWSDPLSSIYGLNSMYIYSPANLIDNEETVKKWFYEGKKSYVVLPENSYDFEHDLKVHFNLILDREFSYGNLQYELQKGSLNPSYPLLTYRTYKTKIYLLTPKN